MCTEKLSLDYLRTGKTDMDRSGLIRSVLGSHKSLLKMKKFSTVVLKLCPKNDFEHSSEDTKKGGFCKKPHHVIHF